MTPETPTPETDAAKLRLDCDDSSIAIYTHTQDGSCYEGDVCRSDETARLERERDAARQAIAEAASHLSGFLGFHSDGLSMDQVRALSATLDKLKPFISNTTPPKP